jgi:hypothetical protein
MPRYGLIRTELADGPSQSVERLPIAGRHELPFSPVLPSWLATYMASSRRLQTASTAEVILDDLLCGTHEVANFSVGRGLARLVERPEFLCRLTCRGD